MCFSVHTFRGYSVASIKKTGKKWRVQVRKKGHYLTAMFATKGQASAWAAIKEGEIDNGTYSEGESTRLVSEALEEYGRRVSIHKPGNKWEQKRLLWWAETWLADLRLDEITRADIAKWRDERLAGTNGKAVTGSTVNRDFNLLSHVFSKCVKEWLWMKENPCVGVERPKESVPRERRVSASELETMRFVLDYEEDVPPQDVRQLTCCLWLICLETAMRLSEAHSIREETFFPDDGHVQLNKTKNQTKRQAICTPRAIELIKLLLQSTHTNKAHNISKCFENAIGRAGIKGMTFHDSRHEGITRLAQKLNVLELAKSVGTKNLQQLMTYFDATPAEMFEKLR